MHRTRNATPTIKNSHPTRHRRQLDNPRQGGGFQVTGFQRLLHTFEFQAVLDRQIRPPRVIVLDEVNRHFGGVAGFVNNLGRFDRPHVRLLKTAPLFRCQRRHFIHSRQGGGSFQVAATQGEANVIELVGVIE
jgi:hypothetical protein